MKIAEIVGLYADGAEQEIAPDNSLLHTIANAFTRSGKVKRPLNQQLSAGQPIASQAPFLSVAVSDEHPVGDAVSNAKPDPSSLRHNSSFRAGVRRLGQQLTGERAVSNGPSIYRAESDRGRSPLTRGLSE
jgi:hypothetical protein